MRRPINISPLIYESLLKYIHTQKELDKLSVNPIPFLLKHDLASDFDILLNSVFELETGEEVLINKQSIQDLKDGLDVHVIRLYDQKVLIISLEEFKHQLLKSEIFDYVTE